MRAGQYLQEFLIEPQFQVFNLTSLKRTTFIQYLANLSYNPRMISKL